MKEKLELLQQKVAELIAFKSELVKELKIYVVDKSISLDERWDLFIKADVGEELYDYENFVNFSSDDWCDHFNRHQTIDLTQVKKENWYYKFESDEAYNEFREDVLSRFIKSFKNDW